jgi:hypothetical protein
MHRIFLLSTLRRSSPSAALVLLALPAFADAQLPDLPTLEDLGIEYISRSGYFQLLLSGRLDIEGHHITNEWDVATEGMNECDACHASIGREMQKGEGLHDTHRLRVFADIFLGDHLYALVELRDDRGRESYEARRRTRLEQGFVRAVTGSGTEGLQVGRFASPFGSYASRHLSEVDPFLNAPLPYDYRTVLNRWRIPAGTDDFQGWKDTPGDIDVPGAPPVWDTPYPWGAMAFGRLGPLDLRAAAMNSAPSSHPNAWDLGLHGLEGLSWIVGVRWPLSVSWEVGASYDRGAWMWSELGPELNIQPPGSPVVPRPDDWRDFTQELFAVDIAYLRGPVMVRAEAMRDRWQVPNVVGTPTELGYTVELQTDLAAGLFVAARGGYLDFRPLAGEEWDYDVRRLEAAAGYRLSRNTGLLLSGYRQVQAEGTAGDTDFIGLRIWWEF